MNVEESNSKSKINFNHQSPNNKLFDLEDRTKDFSKRVIAMVKTLPKGNINFNLSNQLIRSATSIGANYREANESITKKDFAHKINLCTKEAKETTYWLELLKENCLTKNSEIDILLDESGQLLKIFTSISLKSRN